MLSFGVGYILTCLCIGTFDSVNRFFAEHSVITTSAIVTDSKYQYYWGRYHVYVTIVELPEEGRKMKIKDYKIFEIPSESVVVISYRKGFFGLDIIANIDYNDISVDD